MTIPPTEAEKAAFRRDLAAKCDADGPVARALRKMELEAMATAPSATLYFINQDRLAGRTSDFESDNAGSKPAPGAKRWIDRTAQD